MKRVFLLFLIPLFLLAESIELDKVEVKATSSDDESDFIIEKEGFMRSAPMQKQITLKQALQIAGTNGDPLKALKSFAGIVSTSNDNSSELYIHGSKPRETRFSINHLPIGYLFHLGGLYSVIAPEMTGQIDAYLGGFDVSYTAMGAVVDITPKYPTGSNMSRVHIGMYDADFAIDRKLGENTNLFIGARRSYFDLIAKKVMDELDKDKDDDSKKLTFTLFPQFYDGQMILSHTSGDSIFSLEALVSKDELKLYDTREKDKDPVAVGKINSKVSANTIGARWVYMGENFSSNSLIYRLRTNEKLELYQDFFLNTKDTEIGLYTETVFKLKDHEPMVGFELRRVKAPLDTHIISPPFNDYEDPVTKKEVITTKKTFDAKNYTVFAQDIWSITSNNRFRYGVRAWKTDFQEFNTGIDPRVAFVSDIDRSLTISAAVGKYSQLPQTVFMIEGFGNDKIDTYEFSNHYTLSFQKRFLNNSSLVIEPYYKEFKNLAIEDEVLKYKAVGEGKAYGLDVTYKKNIKNFNIVVAYTFVKAKRELNTNSNKQYRFEGDIPHILQINTNYRFDSGWRVSGFFKYNSGAPYTPIIGTSDYTYEGKTYKKPIYGTPYSARLDSSIDLDIQIGKTSKFANNRSLEFAVELMNITSLFRKNIAGISYDDNYEEDDKYYQMGFLPAFHLTYRF